MIDHSGVGADNVAVSAAFYDAALGALGMRPVLQMPDGVGTDGVGYGIDYPVFWIDKFHPHSIRQHTAFEARSCAAVDAFHSAALVAGGPITVPRVLAKTRPLPLTTQPLCSTPTAAT
jgi:catechol 2,3-dioxygenase-like lactoylglutathione lyase family enzyme